jgi:hypothetical protein
MTRILIRAVLPDRLPFVDYLRRHIPDAEIVQDEIRDGFDTLFRALLRAGLDPAVHMEEDTLLTVGFRAKLETEIQLRPNNVIQFFSMRKADLEVGSRWDSNFLMFQCTYMPAGMSFAFLHYATQWHKDHPEHPGGMDLAFRDFLKVRKEKYWIVCPSLVDHRPVKSMISPHHASRGRQSKTFKDAVE